jgi:hypothetical protein
VLGGIILALVVGGALAGRWWQYHNLPPRLQQAVDNHYTRGVAGAPVVMKEFSAYT